MSLTIVLAAVSSVFAAQTITAAVTAMGKPKRDDGVYAYLYRFLRAEVSAIDQRVGIPVQPDEKVLAVESTAQNPK